MYDHHFSWFFIVRILPNIGYYHDMKEVCGSAIIFVCLLIGLDNKRIRRSYHGV